MYIHCMASLQILNVQVMRDLNKLRRFFTRDTQVLYYSVTYAHLNLVF